MALEMKINNKKVLILKNPRDKKAKNDINKHVGDPVLKIKWKKNW